MNTYKRSLLIIIIGLSLNACTGTTSQEEPPKELEFQKVVLHDAFISEGVAVGDVNKDGQKDVLSGAYWFEGPDWEPHLLAHPDTFDYTKGYSISFLNFAVDVDEDGWVDLIRFDFPGKGVYWHQNPQGKEGYWKEYLIDTMACNESPMLADLDNDGKQDLVFGNETSGEMLWYNYNNDGDSVQWVRRVISTPQSPGTYRFSHGLGFGDVNNDGRKDVIIREGWWEAPANPLDLPWTFHEAPLGLPSSQMHAYDFDGDGDHDVLSCSAHAFGIWWYEHEGDTFISHLIDSTFSQTHGSALEDLNGDGTPELITGKRFFAHQGKDPGGLDPAVIYWIDFHKDDKGEVVWTKHLIDDNSGAGLQVVIEDLNNDGKLDILNANKKGVIAFFQKTQ